MTERQVFMTVFGLRFDWQMVIAVLGILAFAGGGISGFFAVKQGIHDNATSISRLTSTVDSLASGFNQLSKLANDLNADNTLQRYQIEQGQRQIDGLQRDLRDMKHKP